MTDISVKYFHFRSCIPTYALQPQPLFRPDSIKWSNTPKQFIGWRIVWVCSTIFWDQVLKSKWKFGQITKKHIGNNTINFPRVFAVNSGRDQVCLVLKLCSFSKYLQFNLPHLHINKRFRSKMFYAILQCT